MSLVATWTDLEVVILSEVSQTEKDKYCLYVNLKKYDIAYVWNLKNGTNELSYKTEIESQR